MLNFFMRKITDEHKVRDITFLIIKCFESCYPSIKTLRTLPKNNSQLYKKKILVNKEALFAIIFMIYYKAYKDLSGDKDFDQTMALVLNSANFDYCCDLKGLDTYKISREIVKLFNSHIFPRLDSYLENPSFDMPMVNLFIKIVLTKRNKLSKIKINNEFKSCIRAVYFYAR